MTPAPELEPEPVLQLLKATRLQAPGSNLAGTWRCIRRDDSSTEVKGRNTHQICLAVDSRLVPPRAARIVCQWVPNASLQMHQ